MDRVTSRLYIRGPDSQSGYKVLGTIFRVVFWLFFGVLSLEVWVYIKISVKRGEVGLKSVIFRRSTNYVGIKSVNRSNV